MTRFYAFIKNCNLPFSVDEVKLITKQCKLSCECKPRYYKTLKSKLIKVTQPLERLKLDFKGPLPSETNNKNFLTIIDEYSHFLFAIPCPDISSRTVVKCLSQVFSVFGLPSYIHSDRGSAFISKELKEYLIEKGIATSHTTAYNPQGNGQAEKYNGTIMKSIELATRQHNLPINAWEKVLPDVLHSLRSLTNTKTMEAPHERMFKHLRKTATGCTIPSWLSHPGPILLKRHMRNNKYEPLVDKDQLIDANPQYAYIRYPDGRETIASLRHLAPISSSPITDQTNHIEPLPETAFNKPLTPEKYDLINTFPEKPLNETPLYQPSPAGNLVNDTSLMDPLLPTTPRKDPCRSSRVICRPLRLIVKDICRTLFI